MEQARRRKFNTSVAPSSPVQRRHKPDYQVVLFTGLLMLFGLIIMYAIGPQRANVLNEAHNTNFYAETYFVIKQAVGLAIAVAAFVIASKLPFEQMKKYSMKLVQIGFILCAILFIGGNVLHIDSIAANTLGAYRWFNLGALGTFQPSEVLKFALLLYAATFLGVRSQQGLMNDREKTIYPMLGLSAIALFVIIVLQKDMGTGIALASTIGAMLVIGGVSWKILGQIALMAVVLGMVMVVTSPHRIARINTFLHGDNASSVNVENENYHIKNAMIALGTGGLLGLGIGNSIQATGYLPEAINDSVFAIIGETFGFVGATLIVVLFTALLLRILKISDHLSDMSMRLAVGGIFGWLVSHILLNIASMIGLVPLTGITLPMLSFGGTSMVFVAGALGLVYQLSQFTSHGPVALKEDSYENSSSRRGIGGSRYSRSRRTSGN